MRVDLAAMRAQFPALATRVGDHPLRYLDSAATAQVPLVVLDAVRDHDIHARGNVLRGQHHLAARADQAYEAARATVAGFLGAAGPDEVVFTSGTTAAINLAALAIGAGLGPDDTVVVSAAEHHSNLLPWQFLRDRRGVRLAALPVTGEGRLDLDSLDRVLTKGCRLVALTHASNVTGAVTDVARVVAAARAVGARVLLDGAQMAPHGPLDVGALGIDYYVFSGHKCFGPTGIGVLWGRREALAALPPAFGGGGMVRSVTLEGASYAPPPARFEAGTPPVTQAVGLAAALDWMGGQDWPAIHAHLAACAARLIDGLGRIAGIRLVGPADLRDRLPVVSFHAEGAHPHDLCHLLDERGLALRGGHHCAQPLLAALGLDSCSRASLAPYNGLDDVEALLAGLDRALAVLR